MHWQLLVLTFFSLEPNCHNQSSAVTSTLAKHAMPGPQDSHSGCTEESSQTQHGVRIMVYEQRGAKECGAKGHTAELRTVLVQCGSARAVSLHVSRTLPHPHVPSIDRPPLRARPHHLVPPFYGLSAPSGRERHEVRREAILLAPLASEDGNGEYEKQIWAPEKQI